MLDFDEEKYEKQPFTEERLKEEIDYFQNHPLFMTKLPENIEGNEQVSAIQHLLYDDTPENLANHFNAKANKIVTDKIMKGQDTPYWMSQAIKVYKEALANADKVPEIKAKICSNLAFLEIKNSKTRIQRTQRTLKGLWCLALELVRNEIENYGHAVDYCKKAVESNPKFSKPYYRMGVAYEALSKYKEAAEVLTKAQAIDPKDSAISSLLKKCKERLAEIESKTKKVLANYKNSRSLFLEHLLTKGVIMGMAKSNLPGAYDSELCVDNSGKIHTPILFYYPEFGQCDLIQDASEDHTLHSHAYGLLERGLPWDLKKHYLESTYEVWLQTQAAKPVPEHAKYLQKESSKKKIVNIDPNWTILTILRTEGYVVPKYLEVIMVSPMSKFYEVFKEKFF